MSTTGNDKFSPFYTFYFISGFINPSVGLTMHYFSCPVKISIRGSN